MRGIVEFSKGTWNNFSPAALDLCKMMTEFEPEARPSASNCM